MRTAIAVGCTVFPKVSDIEQGPAILCLGVPIELESVMRQYFEQNKDKVAAGTFAWPPPKKFYKDFEARFKAWCGSNDNKTWTMKARNAITRMKEKNPGWKVSRKKGKIVQTF